ncbi:MAG: metallopeptidase TldD-related protein [Terracidiphilus sp.]|jgi:predicted Zn-dependent protease
MNPRRPIAAALLIAGLVAPYLHASEPTRADAENDPVLKAMLTELDRSMSQLQLQGFAKPFFIQYRIEEVDDFQTTAEFGSSEGSDHARQRVARITVRVGDYKTDSSGARGDGSLEIAVLDDDPIALRSTLWTGTDQAYKSALSAYAQKQAELKQVQTPPQADDFSQEKPIISLADPLALHVDENSWADRVARVSGLYRTDSSVNAGQRDIQYSSASFRARATTTWIVNSEGTIVRKSSVELQETFAAGTQAPAGMRLDRSYGSSGTSLSDLDSEATFNQHAVDELASLAELRKAPLVEEEYHGPLLFSADAAADVLRSLLGSAVTATRPALGTEARTNGPFASSYHARVLPDFINVVDDPNLRTFDGKGLLGAYDVDDEGVPAQAVKLVDAGRLDNYLIGRQPVRDFPQSNGHGRAGITGPPRPMIGVLKISAENGLSTADLNQKLLEMAKDRGLQSVYFVQTLGGGLTPRLLYRLSLDGKRELVRGAVLDDVDQRAMRSSIEAAGNDLWVANFFGDPPTTVVAPALLFGDATVRRANAKNDKLPFYPPPD